MCFHMSEKGFAFLNIFQIFQNNEYYYVYRRLDLLLKSLVLAKTIWKKSFQNTKIRTWLRIHKGYWGFEHDITFLYVLRTYNDANSDIWNNALTSVTNDGVNISPSSHDEVKVVILQLKNELCGVLGPRLLPATTTSSLVLTSKNYVSLKRKILELLFPTFLCNETKW